MSFDHQPLRRRGAAGSFHSLLVGLIAAVLCGGVSAHEDILLQIERIDARMAEEGESGQLVLERGELRRRHGERALAERDFRRALELDGGLDLALLGLARNALDGGDAGAALAAADAFLDRRPGDPVGLLERARAHAGLGRIEEADAGFAAAVGALERAGPELYFEWAGVLRDGGAAWRARALAVLDEGVDELGPLVTLVEPAVEIERESGNPRGALARVEALLRGPLAGSVPWRLTKAELLLDAGHSGDAGRTLEEARRRFEAIPVRRRQVPAMLEVERRLADLEARLREAAEAGKSAQAVRLRDGG